MSQKLVFTTRKSPLAIKQTEIVLKYLKTKIPALYCKVHSLQTTGDKQQGWSLEKRGGKGLFTKELEEALLRGSAHVAVHSAKDLPTELPKGLVIAGYIPRENPQDVMVMREGISQPKLIATGSPRRRAQAKLLFPDAEFTEIRGLVTTRLKKVESGEVDATILAAAGLTRLGIGSWPNVEFREFGLNEMVPAVGQGAIALQCTRELAIQFRRHLDSETGLAVSIERVFLDSLGGGCHSAYAAHYVDEVLHVFHQKVGFHSFPFKATEHAGIKERVQEILQQLKLV